MQPARFEHLPREIHQCIARQLTTPEIGNMNMATRNFWPNRVQMEEDLRDDIENNVNWYWILGERRRVRDENYDIWERFRSGTIGGVGMHYQNPERRLLQTQTTDNPLFPPGRAVPVGELPQYMLDSFRRNAHL